jgi:aspartyl-tRNA(Asn)/glutamyl-tRNA(Gln) amidotransferase subunit B
MASLIKMIVSGELSSRGAKNIIQILVNEGGDPKAIAKKEGLIQKNDEAELALIIEKIIFENKKVVDEYKAGKLSALQFLVGQCMKETKGAANPAVLKGLILRVI